MIKRNEECRNNSALNQDILLKVLDFNQIFNLERKYWEYWKYRMSTQRISDNNDFLCTYEWS